ncbi:MAG: LPS assembly protein LptD [Myxococcaceae bacterium]
MLGLCLALIVGAGEPGAPTELEPRGAGETDVVAERVLHDDLKLITTAEGNAKLRGDDLALNADRIVYDQRRRVATAVGHVVARVNQGGKVAVTADVLTLVFDDHDQVTDLYLQDGSAVSKKDVSKEVFLAAETPDALDRAGTTQALLSGNHLRRAGTAWSMETLELTPCDCNFKDPSWSITSSSAVVDTEDERVSLTNAGVWIHHVPLVGRLPVLWLPWLSLPLTDRQSGILFPRPDGSPLNGFSFEQPVFLTLGRSADVTLTPGFSTGGTGPNGIAGPRLRSEFRYVPSTRASGKVNLGLLYDFRTRRDVENPSLRVDGTQRGWRGELAWSHTQDFDAGFGARVDFNAHSDGDLVRDLTVDVIASAATYLRSSAGVFHRGDHHFLGLDVGLRQDIQWGYDWLGAGTLVYPGRTVGPWGPGTMQRLPFLTFGWSSDAVGPARFTFDAEAGRLSPLFSNTGDEGTLANEGKIEAIPFSDAVSRLFAPTSVFSSVSSGQSSSPYRALSWAPYATSGIGNRVWELGERESRDRVMVRPQVQLSATPGGLFSISASAAWRQLAWAGEASGRSWARGYLLLGGAIETRASRWFGDRLVRHVIEPRVEVRALPLGFQCGRGLPCDSTGASDFGLVAYDQLDAAVPSVAPRAQAVIELRQRLVHRDGTELLRLDVGQGAEVASISPALDATLRPTLGETFGRLQFRWGWFSGQAQARVDPLAVRQASDGRATASSGLTRLSARADLDDGRGHGAWGTYENLVMEGTMRSRQPIDLLFLVDRGYTSTTRLQMITFGARWSFGGLSLRYEALLNEQAVLDVPGDAANPKTHTALAFGQHTLAAGWTPACDCMRIDLAATQPIPWVGGKPVLVFPSIGFNVSVARFGSLR